MAKFWELFKKIEEAPEERQEEIKSFVAGQSALPEQALAFLDAWKLRRSMWVMTPDGVGIVTGVYKDFVEVQLTDEAGLNKGLAQAFPPGKLSQAKVGQIPSPRRPEAAIAARLGY